MRNLLYNCVMKDKIKAVVFDIDGTLYSDFPFYFRVSFHVLRNLRFFLHYSKTRKIMHTKAPLADYFEYQARVLASLMHISVRRAKALIDVIVYKGFRPYFKKIKPYPNVLETFKSLKDAGYKVGILSDLPPEQKGELWGLPQYCDVILGSEKIGALKPSIYPFGVVSMTLDVPLEEILYVGNSVKSDIRGAKNAGMFAAYKLPWWRALLKKPLKEADFSFSKYKQLQELLLP